MAYQPHSVVRRDCLEGIIEPKSVIGVVLAGGMSRRMGADKALIKLNGKPLIEHAVASLLPFGNACLIVAKSAGDYHVEGAATVADLLPDCGPLGGIYTAMQTLGSGRYIVIGCDMPHVRSKLLLLLLNSIQPDDEAVVCRIDGRLQPLCAVYDSHAAGKIKAYLDSGERSIKGALRALKTRIIEAEEAVRVDPDLISFRNLNTPADLNALLNDVSTDTTIAPGDK